MKVCSKVEYVCCVHTLLIYCTLLIPNGEIRALHFPCCTCEHIHVKQWTPGEQLWEIKARVGQMRVETVGVFRPVTITKLAGILFHGLCLVIFLLWLKHFMDLTVSVMLLYRAQYIRSDKFESPRLVWRHLLIFGMGAGSMHPVRTKCWQNQKLETFHLLKCVKTETSVDWKNACPSPSH